MSMRRRRPLSVRARVNALSRLVHTVAPPEKKHYDFSNGNAQIFVGQVNQNSNNYLTVDCSADPNSGVGITERVGSAIKVVSSSYRFQFFAQVGAVTPIRGRIEIFRVRGAPQTASNAATNFYSVNPFIYTSGAVIANIIDYNSERNPDFMSQYEVLARRRFYIPMDELLTGNARQMQEVHIPIKYRKPIDVRFNGNTSTISAGQLFFIITMDAGNTSGTVSTLVNIPATVISSGALANFSFRHYYTDV